jgi:serine/threonine protein kinase
VGGLAQVFLGYDHQRNSQVAIKVLLPEWAGNPAVLRLFQDEAKILEKLSHPNIVRFYEFRQDGASAFLVMDYVPGTDLRKLICSEGKPLTDETICKVIRNVSRALSFAHSQNIIHRDVKPANILINTQGNVFLSDFGIAGLVTRQTLPGSSLQPGSPTYMSPEQLQGRLTDARSDIYSLGIVLYEMATGGQRPYLIDSQDPTSLREQLNWQQMHRQPTPPSSYHPQISPGFVAVILKSIAPDPAGRFQNAVDLANAVEQCVGIEQAAAYRSGFPNTPAGPQAVSSQQITDSKSLAAPARTAAFSQRRKMGLFVMLLAAVVLMVLSIGIFSGNDGAAPQSNNRQLPGLDVVYPVIQVGNASQVRLVRRLVQSSKQLNSLAFSSDGSQLAVAGADQSLKIYSVSDGILIADLKTRELCLDCIVFRPEKQQLAAALAGNSYNLAVWDLESGQRIWQSAETPATSDSSINAIAFSSDGQYLAWASMDHYAAIVDLQTGLKVHTLPHDEIVQSVSFSPDGLHLLTTSNDTLATVWDIASEQKKLILQGHTGWVTRGIYSPDGNRIATAGSDTTVFIWDSQTGKTIYKLQAHTALVNTLSFSHEGNLLASGGLDNRLLLWDLDQGTPIKVNLNHSQPILSISFSPDGTLLASTGVDGQVNLWAVMP